MHGTIGLAIAVLERIAAGEEPRELAARAAAMIRGLQAEGRNPTDDELAAVLAPAVVQEGEQPAG